MLGFSKRFQLGRGVGSGGSRKPAATDKIVQWQKEGIVDGTYNELIDVVSPLIVTSPAEARANACLQFDGVGDELFPAVDYAIDSDPNKQASFHFIFKTPPTLRSEFLFGRSNGASSSSDYVIQLQPTGRVIFGTGSSSDSGAYWYIPATTTLLADTWYEGWIAIDTATNMKWAKFEGFSQYSKTYTIKGTSTDQLRIGATASALKFTGKFSLLEVYDGTIKLAPSAIKPTYRWTMAETIDDFTLATAYDSAGNGNHATITSAVAGLANMRTTDAGAPAWNLIDGFTEVTV